MSVPVVVAVAPGSPAANAGLVPGDEVLAIDGQVPRDVIQWRLLVDDADPVLEVRRGGLVQDVIVAKRAGAVLGAEVSSALFDRVRTCDNHCSFCFIYQLPPGLRPSLYVKDDDFRLSFLYGNFTTLTRFTEADLERVVNEGLGPLNVSIHATDPDVRAAMLRNRRGATSLRWLRALLDHGIEVHGQLVVCPGVNDGAVLEDTLCGVLDEYPELATLHAVPLGVSRHSGDPDLRPHTVQEAVAVVDTVEAWQATFLRHLGRRLVWPADEYYLLAGRAFPPLASYEGCPQHENGIGMARTFEAELTGVAPAPTGTRSGFFAWVDGAPADGYRAVRDTARARAPGAGAIAILTGELGAQVLGPMVPQLGPDVRLLPVRNEFFGGNVGVTGLMVGSDIARVLRSEPEVGRYLLPDVCLSRGEFLDGTTPADLPRQVEVIATDGHALRAAVQRSARLPVHAR